MYAQIFFVTSVRGAVFTPHTFANASDNFFGAKMPTPFFFIALSVAFVAFVMVGFFVAVVVTVVFVVIAIE